MGAVVVPLKSENFITLHGIKKRISEIAALGDDDPERSHSREDALWQLVLRRIADDDTLSREDCAKLAARALRTTDLDFPRWYA